MKYSNDKYARFLGLILIIIGISLLLFKPLINGKAVDDKLFYIGGYGEIMSEQPQLKDTLIYSITIDNPGTKNYVIKSIEPILPMEINDLVIERKANVIKEIKNLRGQKEIEYKGQLSISTIKLCNEEMQQLLPIINEFKVTYDNEKIIVLRTGIRTERY